jgi:hypothetical protein
LKSLSSTTYSGILSSLIFDSAVALCAIQNALLVMSDRDLTLLDFFWAAKQERHSA